MTAQGVTCPHCVPSYALSSLHSSSEGRLQSDWLLTCHGPPTPSFEERLGLGVACARGEALQTVGGPDSAPPSTYLREPEAPWAPPVLSSLACSLGGVRVVIPVP